MTDEADDTMTNTAMRQRGYLCVVVAAAVVTVPDADCRTVRYVSVAEPFGYLSSHISESHGYGSVACPWRIELQRGERINITLIDFTMPRYKRPHTARR